MPNKHNYPKPEKPDRENVSEMSLETWLDYAYLDDGELIKSGVISNYFGDYATDGTFLWYKDEIIGVMMCWFSEKIFCYLDGYNIGSIVDAINYVIARIEEMYTSKIAWDRLLIPFSETSTYTNLWDMYYKGEESFWNYVDHSLDTTERYQAKMKRKSEMK